jgi:hypothetical protein
MIIYNTDKNMRCDISNNEKFHKTKVELSACFVVMKCEILGIGEDWKEEKVYCGIVHDLTNESELQKILDYGNKAYDLIDFCRST